MAKSIIYVSPQNLGIFKEEITTYVNSADAAAIKFVAIEDNVIKAYKVSAPQADDAPAFSLTLPEADLSNLMQKLDGATAGNVVVVGADGKVVADGNVSLASLATKTDVSNARSDVESKIGTLDNLATTSKDNLVSAVNEVKQAVENAGSAGAITVETATTTAGAAKSYTIKQGGNAVAVIDIPKDMVVSSGVVENNPDGQPAGTYLVLTLANATNDKVYINVGTLVDIYSVQASATQVQLAINSATREISATIVAGSITSAELAADAVTTVKIANGNVTIDKLAADVQTSLGKAATAVQEVASGSANGTIAVDGTNVAVTGLGSAAYANANTFDSAGAASTAETNAKAYADGLTDALDTRVEALEGITYTEMTEEAVRALFA